ncbi:MAG: chloride channel protein [Gemmatimonadaceae bacterium]|nr:chloride channel protein [Gemmatimonadaceae bacterium]
MSPGFSRAAAARSAAVVSRIGAPWTKIVGWLERRDWDEGTLLMVFALAIGAAAALGVVGFYRLIDLAYELLVTQIGMRLDPVARAFYRPLVTALALWIAWAIVRWARIPDGQTVPDVQLAVAKRGGVVPFRPVLARTLAAVATLAGGGSAGSEGPTAVLGSAIGSAVGRALRFQPRRLKILVGCGAAAGISAAFNAPFAGAFFALEEVLGSFSIGAFSPVVIASVVAAITVRPFLGSHPAFHIPPYGSINPLAIVLLYPLLGVACGLASAFYSRLFFATADVFKRLRPQWIRPLLGGLAVGLLAYFGGSLLTGTGHLAIPIEMFGGIAWYALIGFALAKMLATSLTLGSGGSGGLFTPTLFVGAAFGGGVGVLAQRLLPHFGLHPEAWALVGMAGLISGTVHAPITAIFMVFEMTDDYNLVPPLMIVSVIALATSKAFAEHGLYDGWLARKGEHLAHGADRAIMHRLLVRDVMNAAPVTVTPEATLEELVAASSTSRLTTLPVVDGDQLLYGVITFAELRLALLDRGDLAPILLAADLAEPTEVAVVTDTVQTALAKLNARAADLLPVVQSEARPILLGVLTREDVLAAYERELMHQV